jgi:hypothetical protein
MARPSAASIHAFADRLRPAVRRQFLQAVNALRGTVTLDDLIDAVAQGRISVRLDAKLAGLSADLRAAVATVNRIFDEAQRVAADALDQSFGLQLRFDVVNPRALTAAGRGARLVREVTESTRQGIQATIVRSIRDGIPPAEAARILRPTIGLTDRQAMAVMNYRFSLLEEGASADTVARAAERYAAQLLRKRSETIARTETIRAGREGRDETWRQARAEGLLPDTARRRWVVTDDDRLCPACEPLGGVEVGLDEAFPRGGGDGPPLHPNCRCTTVLVIPRRSRPEA